ncbi:MAG: GNAT family N-acetyltransferase [Sphingobacteriaceae bacterium]|nr:GNAT family N-acetyltransferase [Sphingobacteriaceae bacterium]
MTGSLTTINTNTNIALADKQTWEATLQKLDFCPVYCAYDFMEYQCDYYKSSEQYQEVKPFHLVYQLNGQPKLILPFIALTNIDGLTTFDTFGGGVISPLHVKDLPENIRSRGEVDLFNFLNQLASSYRLKELNVITNRHIQTMGKWYQKVAEESAEVLLTHNLYVDLSWTNEAILSNFRKSYKHLVNKAKGLWNCIVSAEDTEKEIFEAYKNLHIEVSQRRTRSDESWEKQYQMLLNRQAFLVILYAQGGQMVGGAYFNYTKDEAYYSVGVYRRELFDQPLGHLAQLTGITYMKELGLKLYNIGRRYYRTEMPVPDEKILNIAAFKHGFATHLDIETRHILKTYIA